MVNYWFGMKYKSGNECVWTAVALFKDLYIGNDWKYVCMFCFTYIGSWFQHFVINSWECLKLSGVCLLSCSSTVRAHIHTQTLQTSLHTLV